MNWFTRFFTRDKVKEVSGAINIAIALAKPIVESVNLLVPNKTAAEVIKATQLYAVPLLTTIEEGNITSVRNGMLNLATEILRKNLKNAQLTASTTILNTAVQLALVEKDINKVEQEIK